MVREKSGHHARASRDSRSARASGVSAPDPGFRRELGLFDAVVVVAGGIIGVGIFANPSNVARVLDSPVRILLAWSLGGVVALLGSVIMWTGRSSPSARPGFAWSLRRPFCR